MTPEEYETVKAKTQSYEEAERRTKNLTDARDAAERMTDDYYYRIKEVAGRLGDSHCKSLWLAVSKTLDSLIADAERERDAI